MAIFTKTLAVPLETSVPAKVVVKRLRLTAAAVFSDRATLELLARIDPCLKSIDYKCSGGQEKLQIWSSFQQLANASDDLVLRWSPMWLVRQQKVVLVAAYDLSCLPSAIEFARESLGQLVSCALFLLDHKELLTK